MHQKFPDKVPKMIAYILTILWAQQEFEDPGWRIYDHNYRLKAAVSGQPQLGRVGPLSVQPVFHRSSKGPSLCQV